MILNLWRSPQNYWVLLQTADETLDYRQAEKKYMGAKLTIEEGGDHSFQGYERFLKDIFQFLLHD
ncbi:YqiA/YcfP family alpha/beta fold hydrolase [Paraglaciecola sp. Hal342]